MDELEVGAAVREYIVTEILEGDDEGLNGQTPLLQWGILNSMEMTRLLGFVDQRFQVRIAPAEISPAHFKNIDEIAAFVVSHERGEGADGRQSGL
jgi:acyl carrier protein